MVQKSLDEDASVAVGRVFRRHASHEKSLNRFNFDMERQVLEVFKVKLSSKKRSG